MPATDRPSSPLALAAAATALFALRFAALTLSPSRSTAPVASLGDTEGDGRPDGSSRPSTGVEGRGRQAEEPTEIPPRGWKDILLRVYAEFSRDRLLAVAAGVTFYGLLALFPAIAAFVSIYGLVADPASIQQHLQTMGSLLPGGAIEIIGEQVQRIAQQGTGTLGLTLVTGLAVSLWSANAGMKAVMDALNVVYDEEEKRGFLKLNAVSLALTFGAIVFLALALTATTVVPIVLAFVGLEAGWEWAVRILRWPLVLAFVVLGLSVLYRWGPSRDGARWAWLTPGSILAALLWLVVSLGFSFYVANFGSYNETYGSLGAVIGFMTWLWLSTTVVLLGAEFNAEMEHQTARDTTTGPKKPMGHRDAAMADRVAPPADRE